MPLSFISICYPFFFFLIPSKSRPLSLSQVSFTLFLFPSVTQTLFFSKYLLSSSSFSQYFFTFLISVHFFPLSHCYTFSSSRFQNRLPSFFLSICYTLSLLLITSCPFPLFLGTVYSPSQYSFSSTSLSQYLLSYPLFLDVFYYISSFLSIIYSPPSLPFFVSFIIILSFPLIILPLYPLSSFSPSQCLLFLPVSLPFTLFLFLFQCLLHLSSLSRCLLFSSSVFQYLLHSFFIFSMPLSFFRFPTSVLHPISLSQCLALSFFFFSQCLLLHSSLSQYTLPFSFSVSITCFLSFTSPLTYAFSFSVTLILLYSFYSIL